MARKGNRAITADVERLLAESGAKVLRIKVPEPAPAVAEPEPEAVESTKPRPQARYTRPGDDGMNKTERAYRDHLEERKRSGEIYDYGVHSFKLLLVPGVPKSDRCEGVTAMWFTPDFHVFENDGTISFHETKGYLDRASDGWAKFKHAVAKWPFPFYLVRKVAKTKGTWDIEQYQA